MPHTISPIWTELPLKGCSEAPGGVTTGTVQNPKVWQVVSRFSFPLAIPYETHVLKTSVIYFQLQFSSSYN